MVLMEIMHPTALFSFLVENGEHRVATGTRMQVSTDELEKNTTYSYASGGSFWETNMWASSWTL
ncbi:hypothetical protein CsSME_00035838 [Camellia sinensis var. sinensis]